MDCIRNEELDHIGKRVNIMETQKRGIFCVLSFWLIFPSLVLGYGQLDYVNNFEQDRIVGEAWFNVPAGGPIEYYIDSQTRSSYIPAIDAAHATWEQYSAIQFVNSGGIDAPLFSTGFGDTFNTHSFAATDVLFGAFGVAFTPTVRVVATGEILEADVYYNPKARWSTNDNPRGRKIDLQSVAFHEVGHFHGVSHTGVTDASMFPTIQPGIQGRSPEPDDQIAPALFYPEGQLPTGSISGRIIHGDDPDDGIVGGLVFAFRADEEPIETFDQAYAQTYSGTDKTLLPAADNTLGPNSGHYHLQGLPPGDYFVFLVPVGDGLIDAQQISEYLADHAEDGFPREFYNDFDESNNEADRFDRVAVTVGQGETSGINIITETVTTPPPPSPAPEVLSAVPNQGAVNTKSLDVSIEGLDFVAGATVRFSGRQISVRSVTFVDSTGFLDINLRIGRKATEGPRNITVTNPDGQSNTGVGLFLVIPSN